MADPYLPLVPEWHLISLDPKKSPDFIHRVSSGGTPKTAVEELWDGGLPWLTPKEVARSGRVAIVSDTDRTISEEGSQRSSARILAPGTVMLTKRAPVGAVAMNTVPMSTNQGFLNFEAGPRLRPMYLAQWMFYSRPYFQKVATGSTYPELYRADLCEFHMSVPPLNVQDRILGLIESANLLVNLGEARARSLVDVTAASSISRSNRQVEKLRSRLIPMLLTGRVRVD